MVYRENIKYIFSRLFLVLGDSLRCYLPSDLSIVEGMPFLNILSQIMNESVNIGNTTALERKRRARARVADTLILPPVLHRYNTPLFMRVPEGNAHFIGT